MNFISSVPATTSIPIDPDVRNLDQAAIPDEYERRASKPARFESVHARRWFAAHASTPDLAGLGDAVIASLAAAGGAVPTSAPRSRAALHPDAHVVKYTLACLDAATADPEQDRLCLAAAAYLGRGRRSNRRTRGTSNQRLSARDGAAGATMGAECRGERESRLHVRRWSPPRA
ncbi:MAG: hypothetical protein ACRDWD_02175 [Acidimicrobiia bacterium]